MPNWKSFIAASVISVMAPTMALAQTPPASEASAEQSIVEGTARFDRATFIVKDIDASIAFWRDVMNFKLVREPRVIPPQENEHTGWTKDMTLKFTGLRSPDGAGIGLMEVKGGEFGALGDGPQPAGYGGVVFVHVAKNIDAIYERAKKAGAVIKPVSLSRTGRSKQMYLRSPSGHFIEIYEILPYLETTTE